MAIHVTHGNFSTNARHKSCSGFPRNRTKQNSRYFRSTRKLKFGHMITISTVPTQTELWQLQRLELLGLLHLVQWCSRPTVITRKLQADFRQFCKWKTKASTGWQQIKPRHLNLHLSFSFLPLLRKHKRLLFNFGLFTLAQRISKSKHRILRCKSLKNLSIRTYLRGDRRNEERTSTNANTRWTSVTKSQTIRWGKKSSTQHLCVSVFFLGFSWVSFHFFFLAQSGLELSAWDLALKG